MKKTKLIFTALITLSVLVVLEFSGCDAPEYIVKYELTGPSTSAYITFTNENGKNETILFMDDFPWEKTVIFSGYSIVKDLYIKCSADLYPWYGMIHTVNIYVNGTLKATDSSTGNSIVGPSASYRFK